MKTSKWPKILAPITFAQEKISDDFMAHWLKLLDNRPYYSFIEKFNHNYVVKYAPKEFLTTLEIGAGLGNHLKYEKLCEKRKNHYIALEIRENVAKKFQEIHPNMKIEIGDCQKPLSFSDGYFDRILAIHVLEHLPNLPSAIKEMYRLCKKPQGQFSVVIPCEGGLLYTLARKISAERVFTHRYQQSYRWFIEREHINKPEEILEELEPYFHIVHKQFFPLFIPFIHCNLCIGITLKPRY